MTSVVGVPSFVGMVSVVGGFDDGVEVLVGGGGGTMGSFPAGS